MNIVIRISVSLALLAITAVAAHADTRYVSDELVISIRDGISAEASAVGYLKTGDAVSVLSSEGDYFKVRTNDGKEGWVSRRYITSERPKADIISDLTKEVEDLKAASGDTAQLIAERDRLAEENRKLMETNDGLEEDIESAGRKKAIPWFLAGAGVLFLGWLIGRASRQKRLY